jgi:serine/threonine protein kinase
MLVSRLSEVEDEENGNEERSGAARTRTLLERSSPSEQGYDYSGQQQQQPPVPLEANMRFGTVGWAAPELVVGDAEPSFASDVFAMGTLLWELATYKQPFLLVARREEGLREGSMSRSQSRGSSFASTQDGAERSTHGPFMAGSLLPPELAPVGGSAVSGGFNYGGGSFRCSLSSGGFGGSEGLLGSWADALRDDLERSDHGARAAAAITQQQEVVNDVDKFNSRQQKVGRQERDRRAAISRGDSAVLSVAGEVATSWGSHRRRQPQPSHAAVGRASVGGESSLSTASEAPAAKATALLETQRCALILLLVCYSWFSCPSSCSLTLSLSLVLFGFARAGLSSSSVFGRRNQPTAPPVSGASRSLPPPALAGASALEQQRSREGTCPASRPCHRRPSPARPISKLLCLAAAAEAMRPTRTRVQ